MTRFIDTFNNPERLAGAARTVALLIALLITSISIYAEKNVNPDINRHMVNPDYHVWLQRFEHPGREVFNQREAIIKAINIPPGITIADIGAGTGLFTRMFAPAVGTQGTVYAVDIARNFIDEILRQARHTGWQNVIGIVNSQQDSGLKPESIDIAFVCATYHHFEYPHSMLRSIHSALRPGGSLVVIDFRRVKDINSEWAMSHTRANKETVIREIESEGFTLYEDRNFLRANYYLRFTRSGDLNQ